MLEAKIGDDPLLYKHIKTSSKFSLTMVFHKNRVKIYYVNAKHVYLTNYGVTQ